MTAGIRIGNVHGEMPEMRCPPPTAAPSMPTIQRRDRKACHPICMPVTMAATDEKIQKLLLKPCQVGYGKQTSGTKMDAT